MATTFTHDANASTFRKLAAAMWHKADDPSIFAVLELEATAVLAAIEKVRAETGVKVTMTHVVARVLALIFKAYPEVNAKVRWWGKIERRNSVDIFCQVALDDGKDLSGARIDNADRKSAVEIARELAEKSARIRKKDDPTYEKSRGMFSWLPWFVVRPILWLSDFLVNELHFDLSGFGMPRDPFGTAMVTSMGMHGVDMAFAPLTPIARCPLLVLVTEVRVRPWVVGKAVEARPTLRCCATFDHRIVDGVYATKLSKEFTRVFSDPEKLITCVDFPAAETAKALPAPVPTS